MANENETGPGPAGSAAEPAQSAAAPRGGTDADPRRLQDEAARLGLAVIAQATAITSDDPDALAASESNLRETVDDLVDEPLTAQQEEVVETLGTMGGSLTAGLGSALAHEQGRDPSEVLTGAATSIVWQQHLADQEFADAERPDHGEDDAPRS